MLKISKFMKSLIIIMLFMTMLFAVASPVYAEDVGGSGTTSQFNINRFDGQGDSELDGKADKIVGAIVSIMRIVGTGVAIIMLIAVAIKYMSSAPGERAEIKKHAVIYVVGAIVLFATTGILTIIQNFAKNVF